MIKEALKEEDDFICFKIPRNIISPILLNDKDVQKTLTNWFAQNNLMIKQERNGWYGKEQDVQRALILLKDAINSNDPNLQLHLSHRPYAIDGRINLLRINQMIRKFSRQGSKWYLDKFSRTLLVPESVSEKQVQSIFKKLASTNRTPDTNEDSQSSVFGDIFYCEDPPLSRWLISLFFRDGTVKKMNFCTHCFHQFFSSYLRRMYNEEFDSVSMEAIVNDEEGIPPISSIFDYDLFEGENSPILPFGQLFWSLINEPLVANQARVWITALAFKGLKSSNQVITYCPQHPHILLPMPPPGQSIKCQICDFILCDECRKWHKLGNCQHDDSIPLGSRICPSCKNCVIKSEACNHIACRCGKHFCYYCGAGPWDNGHDCYSHMSQFHAGCFNDPPDYRKYVKGETVSDQELEAFYRKYPQWDPHKAKIRKISDNHMIHQSNSTFPYKN